MVTNGFVCGYSDDVILDTPFNFTSSYLYVSTTAGDIVYKNSLGQNQVLSNAALGYHPIGATQILTSAIINEVERNTTATGICYLASSV